MKIFITFVFISVCIIYGLYIFDNTKNSKIETFKNGSTLKCYGTLIVSNENWKLNDNHLYNHNSAGYVNINDCE